MRFAVLSLIIFIFVLFCSVGFASESKRPVVLLFSTVRGEGADRELAESATRAIKNYLKETQRVDVAVFDRDSATVQRAIMEKRLTPDSVASYSSRKERLEVAKVLAFDYAAGGEISVQDSVIKVKLWLARVNGGKHSEWETMGSARAAGAGVSDYENAMQSAASAAVLDALRVGLKDLPVVKGADPNNADDTIAINPGQVITNSASSAKNYATKAEESLNDGKIALAIEQYKQAVNADPANPIYRIKLAEAYARKGLFKEAYAEIGGAAMIGASAEDIAAAKDKIARIERGEAVEIKISIQNDKPSAKPSDTTIISSPQNAAKAAISKMAEGDKLWNQGRPDEAAEKYAEAVKLNPSDWRTHERLAVIYASLGMFNESRKSVDLLKKVQPDPSSDIIANRYEMFRKAFDKHFSLLLQQYDNDTKDFEKKKITRESYYTTIKGIELRLNLMAQFLDVIDVPAIKQPVNLHRSLACGLFSQAMSSMLDYLETNKAKFKSNAETFILQAKKEIEKAITLEANRIVLEESKPAGK